MVKICKYRGEGNPDESIDSDAFSRDCFPIIWQQYQKVLDERRGERIRAYHNLEGGGHHKSDTYRTKPKNPK